jgi:hypothetical protein
MVRIVISQADFDATASTMNRGAVGYERCGQQAGDMAVDDILLKALKSGKPATVNDILKHFERRVRIKLDKLRVRGVVLREGRGGAHREFTYRLLRPYVAAKALGAKGGGLARRKIDAGTARAVLTE